MKPKHRPPKTQQLEQDPKIVLLAMNLLIESHKSNVLPSELIDWLKIEIVEKGISLHIEEESDKKAA